MSAADAQPVLPLEGSGACINMESVNRIAKLPVVESTIQTATNIYEKVKVSSYFRHLLFGCKIKMVLLQRKPWLLKIVYCSTANLYNK